jgi:hypothetical protein
MLISLSGCSSRLDEGALVSGGMRDGGLPLGDLGMPATPPPASTGTSTSCESFDTGPVGQLPEGWHEAHGTWRVAWADGARWLQQQAQPQQMEPEFVVWTGDQTWTDLEITAHVKVIGGRSDDCVLARYQPDTGNYYSLCIDNRMGGGGGPGGGSTDPRWELSLHNNDQQQQLATGPFADPAAAAHDLGLRASGGTLLATIDGVSQPPVVEKTLSQGAPGLSTEDDGRFTQVCTGRR